MKIHLDIAVTIWPKKQSKYMLHANFRCTLNVAQDPAPAHYVVATATTYPFFIEVLMPPTFS